MSSGLLLAAAAALLAVAFLLAAVVLAGAVALFAMRPRAGPDHPSERRAEAARAERAERDRAERERQKAAARGRDAEGAERRPRTLPTVERPVLDPGAPRSGGAGLSPNPLQPGPMIGFFDDETSTGTALKQARQTSLSAAFLNTMPPTNLAKEAAARSAVPADPDDFEGEATEIFSANTVSAELAALLDEPDEATPGPSSRRGR